MRLNTDFWVTFVILGLCRLIIHFACHVSIGIYTLESISMYPMGTLARG